MSRGPQKIQSRAIQKLIRAAVSEGAKLDQIQIRIEPDGATVMQFKSCDQPSSELKGWGDLNDDVAA